MTNDEIVDLFSKEEKLEIGMVFTTRDLVLRWGSEKQKITYEKDKKLLKNTKEAILKEVNTECVLEVFKEGREKRYKVVEVFQKPIEKVDGRKSNFIKKERKLSDELFTYLNTSGVYIISDINGNNYIGSSKNVYKRFIDGHLSQRELSRSRFLDKDSMEIKIFEFTRGIEDREFLYEIETLIIEEAFKLNMNLVNEKNKKSYQKRKKEENSLKNIKVKKSDYQKALEILRENGIVA